MGHKQRRFFFALVALFFFATTSWAAEIEIPVSLSKKKLIYDADSGRLYVANGKARNLLEHVALPRQLDRRHLVASATLDKKQNYILLRHGLTASLINLGTGRAEMANFGPIHLPTLSWAAYDEKFEALIFPNRSLAKIDKESSGTNLLIITKDGNRLELIQEKDSDNAGFLKPPEKLTLRRLDRDRTGKVIEFAFDFVMENPKQPGELTKGVVGGRAWKGGKSDFYEFGYGFFSGGIARLDFADLDFKQPYKQLVKKIDAVHWTFQTGSDSDLYLGPKEVKELTEKERRRKPQDGIGAVINLVMTDPSKTEEKIEAKIDQADTLFKPAVERVKKALEKHQLQMIEKRLDAQIEIGELLRKKLNLDLIGQPEAIDAFVKVAQRQQKSDASRAVMLLGGTTGVGKTSGFAAFINALFPKAEKPLLEIKMSQMIEPAFFTTELFGSAPGYEGGQDVTKLMVWLMENPAGGGLFFDEIDKTDSKVVRILQTFLEDGVITIRPDVVAAILEMYEDVPKEKWPQVLREKTEDGEKTKTSFELRLTPKHIIGLATNAGAEIFTGVDNSSLSGQRLASDQQIELANAQFGPQKVIEALKKRGYMDNLLNRVTDVVAFKVLTRADLTKVYAKHLANQQRNFAWDYRLSISFADGFAAGFANQFYDPLQGARFVINNVKRWVGDEVNAGVLRREIPIGSRVELGFVPGTAKTRPQLTTLVGGKKKTSIEIGEPPDLGPVELLERARMGLWEALRTNIYGHESELRLIYQNVIAQLARAVKDPTVLNKPILLYLDGTSGVGKTEIAKVIASVLFENPEALAKITMNNISGPALFETHFVVPLTQSIRTNPKYLVALLDELPRAGAAHPSGQEAIHNSLMSILEESILPPISDEYRMVNGQPVSVKEKTPLPKVTIFIATGNLVLESIPDATEMNRDQLSAAVKKVIRDPKEFDEIYETTFGPALRGRLGEPIILSPLDTHELEKVIDKFWAKQARIWEQDGFQISLDRDVREALLAMTPPTLGTRPMDTTIHRRIANPILALVETEHLTPGAWTVTAVRKPAEASVEFRLQNGGETHLLSEQRAPLLFGIGGKAQMGFTAPPSSASTVSVRTCSDLFQSR